MNALVEISTAAGATIAPAGDRIPTEVLTYWDAIERPAIRRARAISQLVLGFDLVPSDERVREFAHGCYDADPVAEAFVDELYLGRSPKEGRRLPTLFG
jgi:hypothetical protein